MPRKNRAQATLEALILLSGLFAFVAVLWAASQPLQAAAQARAEQLDQQAAFERVRFAVRLASVSLPGFSVSDSFSLRDNATVFWTQNLLSWSGPSFNATLAAPFSGPGRFALAAGRHGFAVRRAESVVLEIG